MLLEFIFIGLAIAAVLIFFGWMNNTNKTMLIVGGGLVLVMLGLFMAMGDGIEVKADCLNYTQEVSHVWNCSNYTDTECFGTPLQWSCWAYNETQCRYIDGCSWGIQGGCYGTPKMTCQELYAYGGAEKCRETDGCYIWNESNPQECDTYDTYYNYMDCPTTTMDFNYSQLIAAVLMLVGIGLCIAVVDKYLKGG